MIKSLPAVRETRFDPWVGKILWRRKWQLTPLFMPENPVGKEAWQTTVHGVAKSQYYFFSLTFNGHWGSLIKTLSRQSLQWQIQNSISTRSDAKPIVGNLPYTRKNGIHKFYFYYASNLKTECIFPVASLFR